MIEKFQSAFRLHQSGRLPEAERLYREILAEDPGNAPALHLLGVILYQFGDFDTAIALIKESLRIFGPNPEACSHLASALKARGRTDEAVEYYQKAIELNPALTDAYFNMGNLLVTKGKLDDAARHYEKAIMLNPNFVPAHVNLGHALRDQGKKQEAMIHYERALELNPNSEGMHAALGSILQESGKSGEAFAHFRREIELNPGSAVAHAGLAKLLQEAGRVDAALDHYLKALQVGSDPGMLSDLYNNMGVIYQNKGEYDQAKACYQRALRLNPATSGTYKNLGTLLQDTGHFDDAETYYRKALDLAPDDADLYCNLGSLLQDEERFTEASEHYKKALEIAPGMAEAHWNISLMLLLQGDLEEGWKKYEWRLAAKDARPSFFNQPLWDGGSLTGKRLLISAEQGVGDEIMFASCLPDVITQAESCVVECDRRLVPLFSRSFPEPVFIERVNSADGLPSCVAGADVKIAIGSLPKFLRTRFSSFVQRGPYLRPDMLKVETWRNRLSGLGPGLKVGISWRGGSKPSVKLARSINLAQWQKLFSVRGVHFINLQYGDCEKELVELREHADAIVNHWEDADPLKDLDGFAAKVAALDVVVSVDNSTVHMAGALGVFTLALLPSPADWRWMLDFEDTPWYGTVRLIRQRNYGDWADVFERAASYLEKYSSTGVFPAVGHSYKTSQKAEGRKQ